MNTGDLHKFRDPHRYFAHHPLLAAMVLLAAGNASAVTLNTIPTTGHDQDIVYEAGLANGQVGATGEIGSRQFYETGIYTIGAPPTDRGLPQSLPTFTSALAPNNQISYAFQPFEANNILKFDATTSPATFKSLDLSSPGAYTDLAIVFSAGSINGTPPRFTGRLGYTINYAGGATQAGQVEVTDWGDALVTTGAEKLFNADRTGNSPPPVWPVTPDAASASFTRWSVYVAQLATANPGLSIESVSFNAFLSDGAVVSPLSGNMDVVVFGLAGTKSPSILLQVDTRTGGVKLCNPTTAPLDFNGYELTSVAGSLNLAGWDSFADQNLNPVDGPDAGSTPGNSAGETWMEAAGSSQFGLQEGFLFGSTPLPIGGELSLGAVFNAAVNVHDLAFRFRRTDGTIGDAAVEYIESAVPGDFDEDHDVDGDDLIIWQTNFGSTSADPLTGDADGDGDADGHDFLVWQQNLSAPAAAHALSAVPEPGCCVLAAIAIGYIRRRVSQAARCTSCGKLRASCPPPP